MARSIQDITRSVLSTAWRRRYLVCVPIAAMPVLALGLSFVLPRAYETRMTILVQEPARLNPLLNDLSVGINVKDRMPALNALLHSEHVIGKVLQDVGAITPETSFETRQRMVADMALSVTSNLIGSEMIELKLRGPKGLGLDKTLTAIGNRFIERLVAPERDAVQGSQTFLSDQLRERRDELAAAESALAQFHALHADKLPELNVATVTRLTALQQQLEAKMMELNSANSMLEESRGRIAGTNPVIGKLEDAIVQGTGELVSLQSRYTPDHSEVQAAERKLNRLKEARQALLTNAAPLNNENIDRLWNIAAGSAGGGDKNQTPLLISQLQHLQDAQSKHVELTQEVEQIKQAIGKMQQTLAEYGPIDRQQRQLERTVTAANEAYDTLAKRYQVARLTGALGRFEAPERTKIIDAATMPSAPVTPGRILYMIIGIVAGIIMGAGLAVVTELLDTRIRSSSALAEVADLPLITVISRIQRSAVAKAA